ncbi:Bug family tripartite tricarboxylate transporter substrate binding protein [Rhodoplanes sp. Z2-YC6860]|uniref:Bug family tripartite tricarboxylate transporter substrate binding protein n=1 Tax=Rhodoplanes sp. Z2-YC6860 TaxID=674703 RepID=UPI00078BCB4C|nr:tripartite tricarboxylate transporter substrate-binding protein [Rhodoplanes sp. Z2-YC6860]AMN42074.1 extra-cytoplasmic solute receptor protein [Rhodoplanes sp. Z2-YC6860]
MRKLSLAVAAAIFGAIGGANAQTYPSQPITMLVGYAVGGPSDTIARIMADRMKVSLGQPVIIENVTGAAGSIAVARGARAPHDGYTIVMGDWSTHVVNAAMYDLQYDVVKDFEPVSLLPSAPQIIASPNAVPAKSLKDLIAWIKADPTKISYGMSGLGSPSHVSGVLLQNVTGAKFQLVPYRGAALVMNDLLANTIQFSMFPVTVALPQVRAGAIRAYAITAGQRSVSAPDIPTVDEAGLPDFHISLWWGLWMPKGTPRDIIAKVNAAVVDTLADPATQKRIADQGLDIPPREQQTPQALAAYQKAEIEKWWPIVKAANIKAQ